MERLVELVVLIESSNMEEQEYLPNEDCFIQEASSLATELFVTDEGSCNNENIIKFRKYGYNVFAIEQDRFGWILGGINTDKGIITYG